MNRSILKSAQRLFLIGSGLAITGSYFVSSITAGAESAPIDLPIAPSGFSRASAIYGAPNVKPSTGLSIAGTLAGTYDSNVNQGSGNSGDSEEGDFVISPGANIAYVSEGDRFVLGSLLSASYDQYGDSSEFSGLNYNLSGFGAYNGGKVIATFSSAVAGDRGINRYYGDYVEQTNFSNRLIARYAVSPKTAIVGTVSHSTSIVETEGYSDTTSFNAGIAGFWSATPLLDLGPGFRYALRTSDNQEDQTTIGPNINANYQLSTKVALRSTLGMNFVEQGDLESDSLINWALGLNYKASELWGMNLSLYRDTQSNPSAGGGLDEVTTYRIGYQRKIRRAMLNLGFGYEVKTQEGVGSSNFSTAEDFDYLTLDSSISMPVFADQANITFSVRYRDLSADNSDDSWSGIQTGLGLLWKF